MSRIIGALLIVSLGAGCSSMRFKSTEEVRAEGETAYAEGRYEDSQPYFDELVRRDEEDVSARLKRARARDKTGNPLAAREDYSAVVEVSPEDSRARLYRAELSIRNGDLDAAESDLTYLLGQGQLETYDQVAAYKFMGVIATRRNNLGAAENYFRQATSVGAGSSDPLTLNHLAEAHYNLGQCLFLDKRFPESHDQFLQYARLAPRTGQALTGEDYYLLGVTAYLSRDFEASNQYFAKADPALRSKAARVLGDPTIESKQYH